MSCILVICRHCIYKYPLPNSFKHKIFLDPKCTWEWSLTLALPQLVIFIISGATLPELSGCYDNKLGGNVGRLMKRLFLQKEEICLLSFHTLLKAHLNKSKNYVQLAESKGKVEKRNWKQTRNLIFKKSFFKKKFCHMSVIPGSIFPHILVIVMISEPYK